MLTYSFDNRGSDSLYEHLYKQIKNDILNGTLTPNEKLPSKRALAKHLNISIITIENAYSQLAAEGYIYSVPKSGFYVSAVSPHKPAPQKNPANPKFPDTPAISYFADFVNNSASSDTFPFRTWTKLIRETMCMHAEKLLQRSPSAGIPELRMAIADYLYEFRGMTVEPEQIVVGAGTEYLYGLLIQLLGRDHIYAVENPGYQKITSIYRANDVACVHIPLDKKGINPDILEQSGASVVHISPSHHFPTGFVTPVSRRYELLAWAAKSPDRFIIEDDYDSEFRLLGKPIPSLESIDTCGKVIYMNTFSKSLTSTIRISYMVLPKALMERYKKELSFYACTVSNFEQYTLYHFIEQGYFEKHINRMRNYYRSLRDHLLSCIRRQKGCRNIQIREENAGLHFLIEVDTSLSDEQLVENAAKNGIHISCLSQYFQDKTQAKQHTLVINYSGIQMETIEEAVERLFQSLWG